MFPQQGYPYPPYGYHPQQMMYPPPQYMQGYPPGAPPPQYHPQMMPPPQMMYPPQQPVMTPPQMMSPPQTSQAVQLPTPPPSMQLAAPPPAAQLPTPPQAMVAPVPLAPVSLEDERLLCADHPGELRSLYCSACNAVVCGHCVIFGAHIGHDVVPSSLALAEAQDSLRRSIDEARTTHARFEAAIASMARHIKSLPQLREKAEAQVKRAFEDLRAAVAAREQALMARLSSMETEAKGQLETQAKELLEMEHSLRDGLHILTNAAQEKDELNFFTHQAVVDKIVRAVKVVEPPEADAGTDFAKVHVDANAVRSAVMRLDLSIGKEPIAVPTAAVVSAAVPSRGTAAVPPKGAPSTGGARASSRGKAQQAEWDMPTTHAVQDESPFADMNRASLQFDQFKKQEKDEIAESGEPAPAPQPPRQKSQPRQQSERRKKQ